MRFNRQICDEDGIPICPKCMSAVTRFDTCCPHCGHRLLGWTRYEALGRGFLPMNPMYLPHPDNHPDTKSAHQGLGVFYGLFAGIGFITVAGSAYAFVTSSGDFSAEILFIGAILSGIGFLGLWRLRSSKSGKETQD